MNATRHHCLDEGTQVLVLDGALAGELVVNETGPGTVFKSTVRPG